MSINAASKFPASISSRATAMLGAGPTTTYPMSSSRSAVNGATTGESSTTRMRRPLSPAVMGASIGLVDESCDHIAIGPTDLHLGAGIEHQEAFAVGVRFDLPNQVEVDDRRTVHALEPARVEALLEILHGLAQDQGILPRLDAHIIP